MQIFYQTGELKRIILPKDLGPVFHHICGKFIPGTYVVKASLMQQTGGFDEDIKYGENYELGIRIAQLIAERGNKYTVVNEVLIDFYEHNGARGAVYCSTSIWGTMHTIQKHIQLLP